jgi:signal transduction histidine kinase
MAKKGGRRKSPAKGKRPAAKKRPKSKPAKRAPRAAASATAMIQSGMHDLTNLATAIRAYLELLISQSPLEEKQKYYVDRAREQVEMMVDLVREMRDKMA